MKKINILLFAIFLCLFSLNQEFIEFTSSETTKPDYNVISSEDTLVEFDLQIPGIYSNDVDSFQRISIDDHTRTDSVGLPELPVVSFLVAIPECDHVNMEIDLVDSVKFSDMYIYPAPMMVLDTNQDGITYYREEFIYNESAYNTDENFPGIIAEVVHKGAVRDQHCIKVLIYPVQFNPVAGELNAYSHLKIKLTFDNPTGSVNNNVGIFNEILGNSMINYISNGLNATVSCGAGNNQPGSVNRDDMLPGQKIGYHCDYLIITPDDFFYNEDIWDFANYRAAFNGFDVVLTNVSTIYSVFPDPNTPKYIKIRDLIRNTYNDNNANHTFDGKLAYVNLFGDVELENNPDDGVPTNEQGNDTYYTQLTEGDEYPDIMIGRCSADNESQVSNIVSKTITYTPSSLTYNNEMLAVIGYDHGGGGSMYSSPLNVLEDIILIDGNTLYNKTCMVTSDFPYQLPNEWIYSQPCTPDKLVSNIELDPPINPGDGKKFIFFMGHGGKESWQLEFENPDLYKFYYSDLNNISTSSLPLILSAACWTGEFWTTDNCLAERFLCYDENKGAIGFFGSPIETLTNVLNIPSYFFNSYMANFAYVAGEAIMEMKISHWNNQAAYHMHWSKHFNFFGDPALNLKYENQDIFNPDLVIKNTEIIFHPNPINIGDIVNIEADIRNITRIDATNNFIVKCFIGEPGQPGTIEIGQYEIEGIDGNNKETAYFTWDTQNFTPDIYDIYILIDPENSIIEEDENNNINYTSEAIYDFYTNFPVSIDINLNAHVITFDLDDEYIGQEIIFGNSIFSTVGTQINPLSYANESVGNSCIANLANDDEFQIIQIHKTPDPKIKAIGNPSWQFEIEGSKYTPIVFDINNDGLEEVICLIQYSEDNHKLLCLNSVGQLRWEFDEFSDSEEHFYIDPIVGNFNGLNNSIIILNKEGTLFNIKESPSGDPEIAYSYTIPECNSIASVPVASDINKDGEVEIIFIYSILQSHENIYTLANYKAIDFSENYSLVLDYLSYINPIISDLNNDGESEIIVGEYKGGLHIYNMELELLNFIGDNNIINSELITGDIFGNGNLDIICQVKINDFHKIKAYDINGNQTFFTPVIGDYESCWLSNIIDENKFYLVYEDMDDLYVVNVPEAGASIGWPGQRCNLRNTGVYEQPAFFPQIGETVYWMNTISLSPEVDNIIPEGSTVVIKPGTNIKAHANSILIVHGTLIAEGTEKLPITFTADIASAPKGYWQGITIPNHSTLSMKHCEIKDAKIGILFEDHNEISFNNCFLENNMDGIAVFNSKPILKENITTENYTGIGCYKNSAPILTDFHSEVKFKNGIINNNTGILLSQSTIYLDNGYNDIYNLFSGGYYIYILSEPAAYVKARYNYWGSTILNEIYENLIPSENFYIVPILTSPQSTYNPSSSDESEMLKTAMTSLENGDYSTAEYTLIALIQQYPTTQEAYVSVSLLYECCDKSNGNWNILGNYYTGLYNDSTLNEEFHKLAFGYLNLCKRANGNFSGAIANYESILLNDPTYNDSVFAVIDIGNTYEEAGNYKSTLGQLSYLVPVSRAKHVEKTVDLLLSLRPDEIKPDVEKAGFILGQNYPNPLDKTTTIDYFVPSRSRISIEILDILGKIIMNINQGTKLKGEQKITIDLSDFVPGVYYYVLKADDKVVGTRKMVVK